MVNPLEAMEEMCSKLAEGWPQEWLLNGHQGQLGELRYGLGTECQGRLHNCWALWLDLCAFSTLAAPRWCSLSGLVHLEDACYSSFSSSCLGVQCIVVGG